MNLIEETYSDKKIYRFDRDKKELIVDVINEKYEVCAEYKNDDRTYVAKIKLADKYYILKKFYPRKKLKQLLTYFRDSESLGTLKNVEKFRRNGIEELVPCIGAVETRKNNIVVEEILLMEFCEGRKPSSSEDFNKIISVLDKLYERKRFHGDCNPNNFIIAEGTENIKVIDTKLKKMWFGNYRKHFDTLVLSKYLPVGLSYPYGRDIYYWFAKFVRKIRDLRRQIKGSNS